MKHRQLIIMFIAAALFAACANAPNDPNKPDDSAVDKAAARTLSDKIVDDMINSRSSDIRLLSEETFRAGSSPAQFDRLLEQMKGAYGQPLEAEYKTDEYFYEPRAVGGRNRRANFGIRSKPTVTKRERTLFS